MPSSKLFSTIGGGSGSGGTIDGTIEDTQVAYGSGVDTITGSNNFVYDDADSSVLLTSSTGGLGINDAVSTGIIFNIRRDQAAPTRAILNNKNVSSGAVAQFETQSDAGTLTIGSVSVATGAFAAIASGASFTNGLRIGTEGVTPLQIRTNDVARISITGAGQITIGAAGTTLKNALNNEVSATATAGTATLPSNPEGFIVITINGTDAKIPYYLT